MLVVKPLLACAIASVSLAAAPAFAQQLGTALLDFDGEAGTPQGTVTAFDASIFPQAAGATFTTAELEGAIKDIVRQNYLGLSVNVIDNVVDPAPSGNFTRVVIGNDGTQFTGPLGVADELDFRNKRRAPAGGSVENVVSVLARPHRPFGPGAGGTFTLSQAATFMANTASHELGHVLGLVHSDVVSTFTAGGSASVRASEIMQAQGDTDSIFGNRGFGGLSRTKLSIGATGINVQPETGAAVFTAASAADPARAGDTSAAVGTAAALSFDPNNRVTAVGGLGAGDASDVYKFTGTLGQRITAEIFSNILSPNAGALQSRIADPVTTTLDLIDAAGNVVPGLTIYNPNTNFVGVGAGDAGSDQLIFNFALPAAGTYGVRVTASGTDTSGQYELLVLAPEPTSAAGLLAMTVLGRRTRSKK